MTRRFVHATDEVAHLPFNVPCGVRVGQLLFEPMLS